MRVGQLRRRLQARPNHCLTNQFTANAHDSRQLDGRPHTCRGDIFVCFKPTLDRAIHQHVYLSFAVEKLSDARVSVVAGQNEAWFRLGDTGCYHHHHHHYYYNEKQQ